MPYRILAAQKLSEFLTAIAHPSRIQIVEELQGGEMAVGDLLGAVGGSRSNLSQHLAVLRAHRIVTERREGRFVYYRLRSDELAKWLVAGMPFLLEAAPEIDEVRSALADAKNAWTPQAGQPCRPGTRGTHEEESP